MTDPSVIRYGVLGAGRILSKYSVAFPLAKNAQLMAVASRAITRAREAARQFNVPKAYGSYDELLADPDLEAVIIAVHNGLHCEWVVRALAAGKHVLCEKPLACSSAEVEQMFAAAHKHHRWLMEGFMFRFHPQMVEAKRRVEAGELGRVVHIYSTYTGRGREPDNPRYWRHAGGGALMDIGCYCTNLSRYFAGREPVRATATAHFDEKSGVDLTVAAALEFPNTLTAQFLCSFEAEGRYHAEIVGTDAKMCLSDPWLPRTNFSELVITRNGVAESVRIETPHFLTPFVREIEHFSDCIRQDHAPQFPSSTDAETDSRANMRALELITEASHRDQPSA